MKRDEKLKKISKFKSVLSEKFPLRLINPNEQGDLINQSGGVFDSFVALTPDKKFNIKAQSVFCVNSRGLETGRDAWIYNFSRDMLSQNIRNMIDFYNEQREAFKTAGQFDMYSKKISWTSSLLSYARRDVNVKYESEKISQGIYRPFQKQSIYLGEALIHRHGQMKEFFPAESVKNLLICVSGIGSSKRLSTIIVNDACVII